MNHELKFIENLIDVVSEPRDISITFTLTLNSKDWVFEGKSGTEFNPKYTKELLVIDLKEMLLELASCEDDTELLDHCNFSIEE